MRVLSATTSIDSSASVSIIEGITIDSNIAGSIGIVLEPGKTKDKSIGSDADMIAGGGTWDAILSSNKGTVLPGGKGIRLPDNHIDNTLSDVPCGNVARDAVLEYDS